MSPGAPTPTATVIEQVTEVVTVTTLDGGVYQEVRGAISMRQEQLSMVNEKLNAKLASYMGGRGSAAARWRCPVCGSESCNFYS